MAEKLQELERKYRELREANEILSGPVAKPKPPYPCTATAFITRAAGSALGGESPPAFERQAP